MAMDVENRQPRQTFRSGYSSFAAFIASDKYKTTSIYRRFNELAARDLLYLQSELIELEAQQREFDQEDLRAPLDTKLRTRSWVVLATRAANTDNESDQKRKKRALEIRCKLREYREAILLDRQLGGVPKPASRTLEAFRNVFLNVSVDGKEGVPILGGRNQSMLDDQNELISLRVSPDDDRLTRFLSRYCAVFFIKEWPDDDNPLAYTSERRLHVVVVTVYVILAAVLLFGAIYNLYFVTHDQKRLGLIAGYTTVFALCVGLLTNARRAEIFGACAAYAAVLVVFVSGGLGNSASSSSQRVAS